MDPSGAPSVSRDELVAMTDPESRGVVLGWIDAGFGVAVYENKDLSSRDVGVLVFLRFGKGATFADPPKHAPDGSWGLGWRYQLHGVMRGVEA